jgi:hypothetical protein
MRGGLVVLVVMLLARPAAAGTPLTGPPPPFVPPPDLRVSITNLLVARYNPLGLENQLRIGIAERLSHRPSPLLRDTFIWFGVAPRLSPAFLKIGPSLEVQPLAIFNLRVTAELMQWFPSFGYMQSFVSQTDNWSDDAMKKTNEMGKNYATAGVHFFVEPTLQAKIEIGRFGAIAVREHLSFEFWDMNLHPGDHFFYEPTLDTLVPRDGWVMASDLDVLFLTRFRFVAGVRYSAVHPFYKDGSTINDHQRIGPLFAYTFFEKLYSHFSRPSLILIANWYVAHRYRQNGVPYLVLAFAFASDFGLR